jgi:TRAP-type C4-dicarboxylate transport system substrate-binding protein
MSTMAHRIFSLFIALGLSLVALRAPAADRTIRIATLAPKNSAWGKVFKVWSKAIEKKSDGKLALEVYYNAVQGMEDAMVGKMKTGQLDGAALTSVGLSRINREVLVLQLPGVVDSWDLLDKVRKAMQPEIEAGFTKEGFTILGWGDVGLVRQMSKGFGIKRPSDMRGKHPVVWRNEPMGPTVYATIGGVVPVPLGPPEVLPALRSGKIDVINAPALAAEQLQWTPYLDHVGSNVTVCAIGGTVMRKKALDDLPADLREIVFDIQRRMEASNANRVRKLDDEAYQRMVKRMTVVELSEADKKEWEKVLRQSVNQLGQGTFNRALIDKVLKISGKG